MTTRNPVPLGVIVTARRDAAPLSCPFSVAVSHACRRAAATASTVDVGADDAAGAGAEAGTLDGCEGASADTKSHAPVSPPTPSSPIATPMPIAPARLFLGAANVTGATTGGGRGTGPAVIA